MRSLWGTDPALSILLPADCPASILCTPPSDFAQPSLRFQQYRTSIGFYLPTPSRKQSTCCPREWSLRKRNPSETRLEWNGTRTERTHPLPPECKLQLKASEYFRDSSHTPVASHSAHSLPCFQNLRSNTVSSRKYATSLLKRKPERRTETRKRDLSQIKHNSLQLNKQPS